MIDALRRPALPLADAPRYGASARRTAAVRWILAGLAAALLVAALLSTRGGRTTNAALLPAGSRSVVVLDLSASLSSDTFSREGATISRLADSGGRMLLVLFSDIAYERCRSARPPPSSARSPASSRWPRAGARARHRRCR